MDKLIIYQQKLERNFLQEKKYIERISVREKKKFLSSNLIKVITGPRRAGKSVFCLQLLQNKNFAYLNFDDAELLSQFDEKKIETRLHEIYNGFEYLMLDEIQNLPKWELWVAKLYRRGYNLIITGSNAKLLSSEIASSLTGRYLQINILPFSFTEYLKAKQKNIPLQSEIAQNKKVEGKILFELNEYLQNGGFPEVVYNTDILRNYLSALYDSVLLKDILKRYKVRQTKQLYDLANYLLSNYCNYFSFTKLKTDLDLNSVVSTQKFFQYLEDAYIFQKISRYSPKLKAQIKSQQKLYCIDNGFIKSNSFELSPNVGRLMENVVCIELIRRNFKPQLDLFYYKTKSDKEIDFVVKQGHKISQLIQVSYDISNPKTFDREINALVQAANELRSEKLLLLNWDKSETLKYQSKKIIIKPLYEWLTEND